MNTIAFMTANYVARQVNYHMPDGWMQGQNATVAHFTPIETFASRFEEILQEITALGFEALDIWLPLLGADITSEAHISTAQKLLAQYNLRVVSLAGGFGSTLAEFENCCRLAVALETSILGGGTDLLDSDRAGMVKLLKAYNLKFGLENHPEKTPEILLERIGDGGDGTLGVAVDTGWFGTYGYNAATALDKLKDVLFHVHLKDVLAVGGHDTCRFGAGVVAIEDCVGILQQNGYSGAISIEHEPKNGDPTEDVRVSFEMLKAWLA